MLKVFAVNSLESVQNSTFSYFPGTFGYVIATSRKPLMNSVCTKLRKWHKKEKAAAAASFHKQQQLNWIKNILSVTHIKHFKITYAYLKFRRHEPAGCYVAACLEKEEEVTIRWAPGISHGWLTSWSEPYKSAIDSSIHHFFTPPANLLCQDSQKPAWALHCVRGSRQQARTRSSDKLTLTFKRRVNSMMDGWVISMIARPKCLSIKLIKPVNRWLGDGSRTRKRQA